MEMERVLGVEGRGQEEWPVIAPVSTNPDLRIHSRDGAAVEAGEDLDLPGRIILK